jgi:hypothetical protein
MEVEIAAANEAEGCGMDLLLRIERGGNIYRAVSSSKCNG